MNKLKLIINIVLSELKNSNSNSYFYKTDIKG